MRRSLADKVLLSISLTAFASTVFAYSDEPIRIIRRANCFACHSLEVKRIGPAYKDVAARYRGDENAPRMLFDKVRMGGAGNWGNVAMTPHPIETIGDDDLKAAIQWILSRN